MFTIAQRISERSLRTLGFGIFRFLLSVLGVMEKNAYSRCGCGLRGLMGGCGGGDGSSYGKNEADKIKNFLMSKICRGRA